MSQDRRVSFMIPAAALDALFAAARRAGRTPADLLREAVVAALWRSSGRGAGPAGVAEALRNAADWIDLQRRLRAAGLVLRASAGRTVALHDWPSDRFLMPGPAAGFDLAALTLRFRAPFPGFAGLPENAAVPPDHATLPAFVSRRSGRPGGAAATRAAAPALVLTPAARVPGDAKLDAAHPRRAA